MKPLAQINVIPFIDVMLVLLAVVLTTATFVAQGKIPVTLPESRHSEPLPSSTAVEITIDAEGTIYFDDVSVTPADLGTRLDGVAPSDPVLLRVDGETAFGQFVEIVDMLKARSLENLSIVTRREH